MRAPGARAENMKWLDNQCTILVTTELMNNCILLISQTGVKHWWWKTFLEAEALWWQTHPDSSWCNCQSPRFAVSGMISLFILGDKMPLFFYLFHADIGLDLALEAYGVYFIKYAIDMGYDSLLRSLGPDVRCFIENLDTVHTLLALSYHNIVPPIFR